MNEQRLKLNDGLPEMGMKMSEGNPGALNVIMALLQAKNIDPSPVPSIHYILLLDSFGIYESDIWVLFNDLCDRDMAKMMAVLKATQMGMFDATELKKACGRQDRSGKDMVPVFELYLRVKKEIPQWDANRKEELVVTEEGVSVSRQGTKTSKSQ